MKRGLIIGLIAAAVILIGLAGYWFFFVNKVGADVIRGNDQTPPEVSIVSPTMTVENQAYVNGTVAITIEATDNKKISEVMLYKGSTVVATMKKAPYIYNWDTTKEPVDGPLTFPFRAKAFDLAGNYKVSELVAMTIDTVAPTVKITAPAHEAFLNGTVDLTVDATDDAAIAKVEIYRGSVVIATLTNAPYIFSWDTTQETNGMTYPIRAKAYDAAGNIKVSDMIAVTIDN